MNRSPARRYITVFFLYASMVLFFFRDVCFHLSTQVLAGSQVGGVFVWEFWWFGTKHMNSFFTTALMFPSGVPVFLQSPWIEAAGVAVSKVSGIFISYNFLMLAAFVGAGLSMFHLAYRITKDGIASFLAGTLFMFSHYELTQHALGQLGEASVMFVPLLFSGTLRLREKPDEFSLEFFVGLLGTVLTTAYVAFAAIGIGLPVFIYSLGGKRDFLKKLIPYGAIAAVAGGIAYGPVFLHFRDFIGGSEQNSLGLLSFFNFPIWHPSPTVQKWRQWTGENPALPENLMGFLSFTLLALLGAGWARRAFQRSHRPWVWLVAAGIIFSLGPALKVGNRVTTLPLPYVLFKFIPVLSSFRTPSRMILLAWVGLSVLAAVAFADVFSGFRTSRRVAWMAVLLAVYSWEMAVGSVGKIVTPLPSGRAYQRLGESKNEFGILELPVSINKAGDITINAQRYMLAQALHGKSLVLGRPPRHTWASLSFCESTDFIYELTHPVVMRKLLADPSLAPRLTHLQQGGREVLLKNNIHAVLLHTDDLFFPTDDIRNYETLLKKVLGEPSFVDETGCWIYQL